MNTDEKESLFRLRRERIHSKSTTLYIWQGFRRRAVYSNLRLSVQICVPKAFKKS